MRQTNEENLRHALDLELPDDQQNMQEDPMELPEVEEGEDNDSDFRRDDTEIKDMEPIELITQNNIFDDDNLEDEE
jgi:hypothetical protein